jgi:hypothetical protein
VPKMAALGKIPRSGLIFALFCRILEYFDLVTIRICIISFLAGVHVVISHWAAFI